MRIGIDVDDTITDTWEYVMPYFSSYFNVPEETLKLSKPYYESIKDKITKEEYFEKVFPIYETIIPNAPIKKDVKEVIDKLYELGHKVYFITARGKGYTDPHELTTNYLNKNNIKYEQVFIGSEKKEIICQKEHIDLFIDDSIKHCNFVKEMGIDVLLFETAYNKEDKTFKHVKNWNEVYDYIKSR